VRAAARRAAFRRQSLPRLRTMAAKVSSAWQAGMPLRAGAVGTSADNAAAEAFNATLKRETLQGRKRWSGPGECQSPRIVETVLCHFGPELGCWRSPLLCHLTFERDRGEPVVGGVPAGGVVRIRSTRKSATAASSAGTARRDAGASSPTTFRPSRASAPSSSYSPTSNPGAPGDDKDSRTRSTDRVADGELRHGDQGRPV
jgi:transposase InsO family protein